MVQHRLMNYLHQIQIHVPIDLYQIINKLMFFNDLVQINGDVDLDLMKIIHQSVLNQCDGFYVEYQPVVHAQTGEIAGAEALVRWKKEPYGIVPPGMFIDWLESNPCMYDLGNFVLKQALTVISFFYPYPEAKEVGPTHGQ